MAIVNAELSVFCNLHAVDVKTRENILYFLLSLVCINERDI